MKANFKSTFLLVVLSVFAAGWMHSQAAAADMPTPGQSKTIDAIKKEGNLRVGIMAGYPWLEENTSGQGEPYSGPAWILANSYAKLLGVKLELIPVSHETKVPVVQNGQAQMSIAPLSVTPPRQKVVDFVVYSNSSVCMFGKAGNPKLAGIKTVDDLNREEISIAYFTGGAEESWVPKRFPKAQSRGVSGSGTAAPVEETGLKSWPEGDACLTSTEFSNPVGLALAKGDEAFLNWARAVADEMKTALQQEELRLIRKGEGS